MSEVAQNKTYFRLDIYLQVSDEKYAKDFIVCQYSYKQSAAMD